MMRRAGSAGDYTHGAARSLSTAKSQGYGPRAATFRPSDLQTFRPRLRGQAQVAAAVGNQGVQALVPAGQRPQLAAHQPQGEAAAVARDLVAGPAAHAVEDGLGAGPEAVDAG